MRLTIIAIFFLAKTISAATVSFTGASSQDWLDPTNWTPSLPTTVDLAEIRGSTVVAEIASASAVARYVDVRDLGVVNVTGGSLAFGFSNNRWMWVGWQTAGTVNQSGGSVTGTGTNVDLIIDSNGTYNMTGGVLNVSDDLRLNGNAVFNVAGDSVVNIGDDLRVESGASVEFNIQLVGAAVPTINITDDFVLRDSATLNIDATNWTGVSAVSLFVTNGTVVGDFAQVTLNGQAVPASDYQFNSGSVVITVSETSAQSPALLGMMVMFFACSKRTKRGDRTPTKLP
ncbi:MAG: hypothetical protein KDB27_11110 [Planctomycetales bacterium]|nr:hypothetical protein [Planctomycetales bacterium]